LNYKRHAWDELQQLPAQLPRVRIVGLEPED